MFCVVGVSGVGGGVAIVVLSALYVKLCLVGSVFFNYYYFFCGVMQSYDTTIRWTFFFFFSFLQRFSYAIL